MLNKFREPVNGLTHFFAAIVSAIGLIILLVLGWNSLVKTISLSIYGVSLILLFTASAAYHSIEARPGIVEGLRKFDHAAIYLLIAGTYTPMCMIMFSGFWKWGLLAIVWSAAIIGIIVKMFIINAPRWVAAGLYLIMGWLCITAIGEMLRVLPAGALVWLLAGGIIYTLGAIVYITNKLDFFPGKFGSHEVWHTFVILGALAHYISIAVYIAPAS